MTTKTIQPEGWAVPKGFANGTQGNRLNRLVTWAWFSVSKPFEFEPHGSASCPELSLPTTPRIF